MVLGVNTCLVLTWMRKVVGSNPDDSLYRTQVYFCYRFGRRLLRDRKTGNAGNDKQMREARGRFFVEMDGVDLSSDLQG